MSTDIEISDRDKMEWKKFFSLFVLWRLLPISLASLADCPCKLENDIVSCEEQTIGVMPLDFEFKCPELMKESNSILGFELQGQTMTEVLPQAFTEFTNLIAITLSFNQIQEVHPGAFDGLDSLASLSLSHNNISEVPNGVFDNLIRLHHLDLSYNPIENFTTK